MIINKNKQRGATMVSWLLAAGVAILLASAVVKVAPYYVEFNSVKGLMKNIASEPGIKNADKRVIYSKVEKYLNLNSLRSLEYSYYGSKDKSKRVKNPFTLTKLKKGNNRKVLTVTYDVPENWFYNLNFLIKFKHSVILGEPDVKVDIDSNDLKASRDKDTIKF
ncbi:DUF4845 domain-containing protein [Cocleimonas sp. KMM 6892]|uniref:DUF4845 domain-containing protein n=1 Tax=unclassified Cocleimonas TaxID=2639732 RepID=UPI002DB9AE13|nr:MULTISPECIES: DUF4845 domain-containing protein [unclassified Cocleimonas]MEB8433910.1 DUF4845 domain-containing protein [Cocleimonas sp. KMM 6892]MEC4716721.1 DUF4845 domain-containing protein [Cocleimonas sp. KMM 6895]MEC4746124.1 DUF4845 domain-containing protein [Cocleimonas sp. KMM 6896]